MLKTEDTFRVECVNSISEDMIVSLLNLYQPLIYGEGVLLYLTLHAEARHSRVQSTHRHLCTLMNMSIDTLERARFRLEQYGLLKSYQCEKESHDNYIYHLNNPLNTEDFLSNSIYMSYLYSSLDQRDVKEIVNRLGNIGISKEDFHECTKPFKHLANREVEVPMQAYAQSVKPRYRFSNVDTSIHFDYEKFLGLASELVFPIGARTEENLEYIGKMGTLYGITPDRMVKIVKYCTSIDSDDFDTARFKRICENEKIPEQPKKKDPYSLSPVSFLQSKNNGKEVSLYEKRILESLVDRHFSNEVINIMVEYILRLSGNRMNEKFVDMVASEWARDGIETREQALLETKKQLKSKSYQPRFVAGATDYSDPKYHQEVHLSKQELEEILKKQKEMK